MKNLKSYIREIPDFPKPGINFKDITPLLENPAYYKDVIAEFEEQIKGIQLDAIIGIESRGFIFGMLLAYKLDIPFVLVRKKGKLPFQTVSQKYDLEYGSAEIEMHIDSVKPGQKVLIHDDLLATGGTAAAAAELITRQGAIIQSFAFLIELEALQGRKILNSYSNNIISLIKY